MLRSTFDTHAPRSISRPRSLTVFEDYWCAVWFTLTTMTTVGYGDYVPRSAPGRAVVGGSCVG